MRKKTRSWWLLVLSIIFGMLLGNTIYFLSPDQSITIQKNPSIQLPSIILFFSLVFLFCMAFFGFVFNKRRGFFIGSVITAYLLLRYYQLTNPSFALLLFALFLCLEFVFYNRDKNK